MKFPFRAAAVWALILLCSGAAFGKEDPVSWKLSAVTPQAAPGGQVWLAFHADIEPGWHLYSPTTPEGGPIVTKIALTDSPAIGQVEVYRPQPLRKLDPNFNLDTETYTGSQVFYLSGHVAGDAKGPLTVEASAHYQACSENKCLPPVTRQSSITLPVAAGASTTAFALPAGYKKVGAVSAAPQVASQSSPAPVTAIPASADFLPFLLTAFGAGVLSLLTPCVFPMIPLTVSFFLNDSEGNKRSAWSQALVFCLGIIVLFTGLGLITTVIAGPFGVVQLGSSPWVNGFIAAVFFVFGLSLLGAFELRLPSGFLTRLDQASRAGGYGGTLLMGLTFSLTSFACIGPIVGPLLISSVQSKGLQPMLGMTAFATGLAAPFFLLALFPGYLRKLPRSGGWMTRVKVVLGFVVLAVMLKYLGNVDQVVQSHWLTRERFLAAWIVLFALPGLYLLGLLRMEGVKRDEPLGVGRALIASLFLIFALSLLPGLFGARLGELDAVIPESGGSLFAGATTASAAPVVFKNDLSRALAQARAENKLVLINFTGYACTNCHWMKQNMFPQAPVQAAMKDLVLVDLFTDGTDADSERNQQLEDTKFHTVSIPFYAILDPNEKVVATFPQLTRNTAEFVNFLKTKPETT